MISDFLDSWLLFKESYLLGWALSLLLPMIGILVILRRQVFVAVAISKSSIMGIAFFLYITFRFNTAHQGHGHSHDAAWQVYQEIIVVVFSLLASLLSIRTPSRSYDQRDMATALVFVLSTAFSYLLLADSPLGLKEIQGSMSSSLISSDMREVYMTLGVAVILFSFLSKFYRQIYLVSAEPYTARAMGLSVMCYEVFIALTIGACLGWSIHLAGWLFVFATMVIPVYIARHLARSMLQVFWMAPLIGLMLNVSGFIFAHSFDYPFSQFSVAYSGLVFLLLKAVYKGLK